MGTETSDLATTVVASLQSPQFTWRTAEGISKETGIDPGKVASFLESSDLVIRSSTANTGGQALYSLRTRYREEAPFSYRILSAITNST